MANKRRVAAALKAIPPGTRGSIAPQSSGMGRISPVQSEMYYQNPYCLAPETRVLCTDLVWRPAGSLHVGDPIIGFDEHSIDGQRRKLRIAYITGCDKVTLPSYHITLDDGREIIASSEHRWKEGHGGNWIYTRNLTPGRQILDLGVPWTTDKSWESGWLAGVFDGEASIESKKDGYGSWRISFCQNPGDVLDQCVSLLKERGYGLTQRVDKGRIIERIRITGLYDCLRLLGTTRPVRLLGKVPAWIDGASYVRSRGADKHYIARVAKIEFTGEQNLIAIGTTTKTLFAEGLFSHNSNYGPFMPRMPEAFSDGAFSPMPPIQPVPVDQPPAGGVYPDPRYMVVQPGYNLPTPPGTEGFKLASFDQLKVLSERYCLSAKTRVLCSDFIWRPLSEISIGDELIAFDENPLNPKQHRKMRTATVTACDTITRPSYRVIFTDGREVVASAEHLWLSGRQKADGACSCHLCGKEFRRAQGLGVHLHKSHDIEGSWKQNGQGAWIATGNLRPGSTIRDLGQPWEEDNSRDAGYLSGVYDGEASLIIHSGLKKGWGIGFPQNPGVVFDTVEAILKGKGYRFRIHQGNDTCKHITLSGMNDCFRFMGEIRPLRLLANSVRWIEGNSPSRSSAATVKSIEFLGDQEVIALGTSTHTLIAEGLFSHNSVARSCIDLRQQEVRGLSWEITLTKEAAKAYQGSHSMMKDFGERAAEATQFFRHPDRGYWSFDSFLNAMLEEIFVYDSLCLIFRPKFGARFGMGGKGLLGSNLDTMRLVPGPTIRPLVDLHGDTPEPPNPGYQQYLFGVPRSDYQTIMYDRDLEEYGLTQDDVAAEYRSDMMLYAPYWPRRESPYGFPPVERALLPIVSGLQKQEFQLDYFKEGSVPAVYISPGDPNITPTQIRELQDALNGIAGDPAFHLKVVVLPPGSKVEPQRPIDLSDSFDELVMEQVCCVPGTEIITRRGLVPIEQVVMGDEVFTHRGRWRKVLATMKSPAHDVKRIEANGFESLEVTGNHKLWAAQYGQTASHRQTYQRTEWVPAADIKPKRSRGRFDAVTIPVPETGNSDVQLYLGNLGGRKELPVKVPMGAAFGRLLGFYMAEGDANLSSRQVQWTFHRNETAYQQQIIDDLRTVFGLEAKVRETGENCSTVVCNSAALARLLSCGTATNKKLPEWAWNGSSEFYSALLWAWVAGDGNLTQKGWRGRTASRDLAWQMRLVALACGHEPQLRVDNQPRSIINGREIRQGVIYTVEVILDQGRRGTYRIDGPHLTSPVRSNESSDYTGEWVYNLNVQEDHSYLTTGGTVKNCMAFDVQPMELGIIPNIGGGQQGPSASAIRFASQEVRDIKSRKSTKPLLQFLCTIFNMVLQDICGQTDMQFQFEGLVDDEDKQAITELGVQQVQNGIASIDEVRDRLDLAPWGLQETSEPVVFTAQGPIPISMAPELIRMAQQGAASSSSSSGGGKKSNNRTQSTNSGQRSANSPAPKTKQPSIRAGGQTKPNGSHKAPISPHRESLTPGHSAARGAIQSPTPRTGGTPSRSSVAGSRKKAVMAELDSLRRHLRKDRGAAYTWQPRHVESITLAKIVDDLNNDMLIDVVIDKAMAEYEVIEEAITTAPVKWTMDYIEGPHGDYPAPPEIVKCRHGSAGWCGTCEHEDYISQGIVKAPKVQWPGWEHDLGLVGRYKQEFGGAFKAADGKADQIRKAAATGKMFVDNATLRGLIAEEIHGTFLDVLTPLWSEAWSLGYESGKALATGTDTNFTAKHAGEALDNFIATEGAHWGDQIARTGLARANARAEVIARSEVARAMNSGAIQAYRDNGVSYKHLLVSPDDTCVICKTARKEGVIPLDAVFPSGGLGGPFHPQCRCVPAPAWVDAVPPQSHLGKSEEDHSQVAFILYRAQDNGKDVVLLQKRAGDMNNPGTWGLPGGTAHKGEDAWGTAWRESCEEMGDLPSVNPSAHLMLHEDDRTVHIFVCDVPEPFNPSMDGSTQHETAGYGWFTRKEIKKLPLQPNFEEQWKAIKWDEVNKAIANTINGEMHETTPEAGVLYPAGARWPYPHRSDGAEDPHYGTAETPEPPSRDPSRNTPAAHGPVDMADETHPRVYGPDGDESTEFPRKRTRNRGPKKLPSQEPAMPQNTQGGSESGVADMGSRTTGVPPSAERKMFQDHVMDLWDSGESFTISSGKNYEGDKAVSPRPAVGSVPAETPKPAEPHATPPEAFDPAENIATETDEGIAYYPPPKKRNKGGPADYSDPNPVDAEHVYVQMAKNFPPDAIQWVKRARWTGPVNVPWDRVDDDDIDSWAASKQPEHVKHFQDLIEAHKGHVAPSILVQEPNTNKAFIVDGHHRALAHKNLNQPVLAYLGNIDEKDRPAALETHSKQVHSGNDPGNA